MVIRQLSRLPNLAWRPRAWPRAPAWRPRAWPRPWQLRNMVAKGSNPNLLGLLLFELVGGGGRDDGHDDGGGDDDYGGSGLHRSRRARSGDGVPDSRAAGMGARGYGDPDERAAGMGPRWRGWRSRWRGWRPRRRGWRPPRSDPPHCAACPGVERERGEALDLPPTPRSPSQLRARAGRGPGSGSSPSTGARKG